eukprot:1846253-Amphidinium_carterae.1
MAAATNQTCTSLTAKDDVKGPLLCHLCCFVVDSQWHPCKIASIRVRMIHESKHHEELQYRNGFSCDTLFGWPTSSYNILAEVPFCVLNCQHGASDCESRTIRLQTTHTVTSCLERVQSAETHFVTTHVLVAAAIAGSSSQAVYVPFLDPTPPLRHTCIDVSCCTCQYHHGANELHVATSTSSEAI